MTKKIVLLTTGIFLIFNIIYFVFLFTIPEVTLPSPEEIYDRSEFTITNRFRDNNTISIEGQISYLEYTTEVSIVMPATVRKSNPVIPVVVINGFRHGKDIVKEFDWKEGSDITGHAILSCDFWYDSDDDPIFSLLNHNKAHEILFVNYALIASLIAHSGDSDTISDKGFIFAGASLGGFIGVYPASVFRDDLLGAAFIYSGADVADIVVKKAPSFLNTPPLSWYLKAYLRKTLKSAEISTYAQEFKDVPTLLINGTDDNSIPAENSQALRNYFEHATVKIIQGRHIGTGRNDIMQETLSTLEEWVERVLVKSDKRGD